MKDLENNQKKLLLIDGNGLAYRSFYALPSRKVPQGFPINAVLGFVNLLLNAIISERPTHIAVAFDHGAFVDTLMKFQSFNVQREEMLDDLAVQLPVVEDFVQLCGIKAFRLPGFEADDCIGTIASKASREGFETLIVAGDLELMQLVSPHVKVMTMRRGIVDSVIYDEASVIKKYNLRPAQLADLRAMAGDSSQNISGVPGIGEVTARRLLSQYSSLTELFDSLEQLPAKWRNPLSENRDDAFEFLSRSTIRFDLPLEIDWEECRFKGFPVKVVSRLINLFHVEGFGSLIKYMERFAAEEEDGHLPERALYGKEAEEALERFAASSGDASIAVLSGNNGTHFGISLCSAEFKPFYIDFIPSGENEPLSEDKAWKILERIIADPDRIKYVLSLDDIIERGITEINNVYAVDLMSQLLFMTAWDHSIESVCARFGIAVYDRMLFGAKGNDWSDVSGNGGMFWVSRAADVLSELGSKMLRALKENGQENIYHEVEMPLAEVMWHLNHDGIVCSEDSVKKVSALLDENLVRLKKEFLEESGLKDLDLDSEEAVSDYLFNQLSLLIPTRPKNGPVLSADMLRSLQEQNPIVEKVRCYYELSEFRRIFVEQFMVSGILDLDVEGHLFNLALPSERRLQFLGRTVCKGAVETMYRMMSVVYNLEYEPVRRPLAQAIDAFLRPRGSDSELIFLHFPAFALRIYAALSGDGNLKKALDNGEDIEAELLSEILGDCSEYVGIRSLISDLLLFYYSPAWLARRLSLKSEDALEKASEILTKFENVFSKKFPICWNFILSSQAKAYGMEKLNTASGRFCCPYEAGSRNYSVRKNAEGFARAMQTEGTCCDIIRLSLVNIYKELGEKVQAFPCGNLIMIHAPKKDKLEIARRCQEICMESSYGFDIKVEYKIR